MLSGDIRLECVNLCACVGVTVCMNKNVKVFCAVVCLFTMQIKYAYHKAVANEATYLCPLSLLFAPRSSRTHHITPKILLVYNPKPLNHIKSLSGKMDEGNAAN